MSSSSESIPRLFTAKVEKCQNHMAELDLTHALSRFLHCGDGLDVLLRGAGDQLWQCRFAQCCPGCWLTLPGLARSCRCPSHALQTRVALRLTFYLFLIRPFLARVAMLRTSRMPVAADQHFYIDPNRCIGCEACVAACSECDTHKGVPMIHLEVIDRQEGPQTAPVVCMHCDSPTCAEVCPAEAIKKTPDGVVQSARKERCISCNNCGLACPFGVPKVETEIMPDAEM